MPGPERDKEYGKNHKEVRCECGSKLCELSHDNKIIIKCRRCNRLAKLSTDGRETSENL